MKYPLYFTTQGPRKNNEDSFYISAYSGGLLLIIADGLGGHKDGAYASKYATQFFADKLEVEKNINQEIMQKILLQTHEAIIDLSKEDSSHISMATTFSCVYITQKQLIGVHTGDTRIYLLREKGIIQLTTDNTEAQALFDDGVIDKHELLTYPRKNILTSALGIKHSPLKIQKFQFNIETKDRILLSSDGFYPLVSKEKIRDISVESQEFSEFFFHLIQIIYESQLTDNCTLLGIEI